MRRFSRIALALIRAMSLASRAETTSLTRSPDKPWRNPGAVLHAQVFPGLHPGYKVA